MTPEPTLPNLSGRPYPATPARVGLIDPADLSAPRRALYDAITSGPRSRAVGVVPITDDDGRLLGPFGPMLLSPEIGDAVQRVGAALRFSSRLSARSRELAILAVAAHRSSAFEWWAHERAALAAGLSAEQLQALLDDAEPLGLDEDEAMVLDVSRALLRAGGLDDERYAAADARLGAEVLAELVWLVGYYAMLALALAVFVPPHPI